jgi:hypothetical protein
MKLPAAASLLLLAACSSSAGNEGAGANGTTAASQAAGNQAAAPGPETANGATAATTGSPDRLQAGQWEMTAIMRSLDAPGMPAERAAAMRRQLGRPNVNRVCMTEEQARNFSHFIQREQRGCTIGDQAYGNGAIRMNVTCAMPGQGGGTVRMTMAGSFTPVTLNLTMNQEMTGRNPADGQPRSVRIAASVSGRRLGPCPTVSARPTPPSIRAPSGTPPVVVAPAPAPQ